MCHEKDYFDGSGAPGDRAPRGPVQSRARGRSWRPDRPACRDDWPGMLPSDQTGQLSVRLERLPRQRPPRTLSPSDRARRGCWHCRCSSRCAAFVQIRAGELAFRGLDESGSLPALKPMRFEEKLPLRRQVEEWRRVLTSLGERFRAGIAEVDPTPDACAYCQLTSLCRIREIESA